MDNLSHKTKITGWLPINNSKMGSIFSQSDKEISFHIPAKRDAPKVDSKLNDQNTG